MASDIDPVLSLLRTALTVAEEAAGERWFESPKAARLCHAVFMQAADVLIAGQTPDDNPAFEIVGDAIARASISRVIGRPIDEFLLRQ